MLYVSGHKWENIQSRGMGFVCKFLPYNHMGLVVEIQNIWGMALWSPVDTHPSALKNTLGWCSSMFVAGREETDEAVRRVICSRRGCAGSLLDCRSLLR